MSEAAPAFTNSFVAGFASRQDDNAVRLQRVFAERPAGFSPGDLIARIEEAFSSEPVKPRPAPVSPAVADEEEHWDPVDTAAHDTNFVDQLEEARQAGFDEGFAAAVAAQDEAARRDLALLEGVLAALKSDDRIDRERIATQLRETVLHLVTQLVGEIGVSAERLAERVETAADLLVDQSESAILRVNPADVALMEGRLPQSIFAVGDAALSRGAFVLEAASTIVEDGPDLWLQQLTQALDKVAVPAA